MNEEDAKKPIIEPLNLMTPEQRIQLTGDMDQDFHLWDQVMTEMRSSRNEQNNHTKSYLNTRRESNLKVKEKRSELEEFKRRRNDLNRATRMAKEARDILTTELQSLRAKSKKNKTNSGETEFSNKADLDCTAKAQDEAHEKVKQMAADAQADHDEMKKLSEEIERIRNESNQAHRNLTQSKNIADEIHQKLVILLQHTSEYRGEVESVSRQEQLERLQELPKLIDTEIEKLTTEFYSELIEKHGMEFTIKIGSYLDESEIEPIEYLMRERVIRIVTDNSGPFIGKGGKHIDEFRDLLTEKFSLPLEVKVRAPYR